MSNNLGSGVSRVLDPTGTQYTEVILQQGKPPMDAEFNLLQELALNFSKTLALRGTPSGWLGNETNSKADFITSVAWSNWFKFGPQRTGEQQAVMWAVVNGWLIPVTGTRTGTPPGSPDDADTFNVVALDPPPSNSGDFRVDFAFLEVWLARVPPNPSALNKPAASAIWRYGNVEGGFTFLPDDLIDPALGFETSERVQLQYRIRVAKGLVGLTSNPDGFDPTVVKAQGAAAATTSFVFTNMRQALGDPGLWRAGDGTANSLGTVDGYSYAIPLSAIFRRNAVAWNGDPSQNLNGAFNRNPLAVDRTGIQTFSTTPTLSADLSASAVTATILSAANIPLPLNPASPVLIKIGDELLTYASITTGITPTLTGLVRGVNGTRAELHKSTSTIQVISGRPDGLFADQVAGTDILDLRHLVNPNGFNYDALLKENFDRLLRGQLRANWKRSGAGPQGSFVFYQDKISTGAVSLGVTRLDAADSIREVFSDAAVAQRIEAPIKANGLGTPAQIAAPGYELPISVLHSTRLAPNTFSPLDVITVPIAQLKAGLPGGDADQIRWINDGFPQSVTLRIDGQTDPVPSNLYTVTPAIPTSADDLTITLAANFPTTTNQIYLTLNAMYGPGRGLSRRPDSLHSVAFINPSTEIMSRPSGIPATNQQMRISWALLWSKYRNGLYHGLLPETSEAYADLGSKTLVVTPFRRIVWPTEFRTLDGTAANPRTTTIVSSATGQANSTTTFTDLAANFVVSGVVAGDALTITNGFAPGRYTILTVAATTLTVERSIFGGAVPPALNLSYTIAHAQGLMPLFKRDGVTPKWLTTDPLGIFSGTSDTSSTGFANTKNIYVNLPRSFVPGWGAVTLPILPNDTPNFAQGVNFMSLSKSGSPAGDGDKNYVPYTPQFGSLSYAAFATINLQTLAPAVYNAAFLFALNNFAGMRFFTDARGLGRQGLELPPFYGIARLFAVYEAQDYITNGSAFNPSTRAPLGSGATNLLRQNMDQGEGPVFWIELDDDGDSTFILNAKAIDITRSPNPIASFSAGNYVIEASIFGFDRGSFDITKDFRLVLTRPPNRTQAADTVVRANNIGVPITGPTSVLPGPATASDQIVINYSRTPYQGDPWGSQTSYIDIPYTPGPLTTGTAFQIGSTQIDQNNLTRPNQKVLEVLSSVAFTTTLGTGRLSGGLGNFGDFNSDPLTLQNVGFEDLSVWPPPSSIAARPITQANCFTTDLDEVATEYLGASERLPLGALFRDKDFRGGLFDNATFAPLDIDPGVGVGTNISSLAATKAIEQTEVTLDTATTALGAPGDIIVHVDGEQGNYSLLTNFRVNRGGSVFTGNGGHPGGEVTSKNQIANAPEGHTNIIHGRAYLVRNYPTSVGANEVSSGSELMLLVVTQVKPIIGGVFSDTVFIGTNGSGEGYAAADLYRIEGHPMLRDNVRVFIDPSTIALAKRST